MLHCKGLVVTLLYSSNTRVVKFCYIYFIIVNMSDVILVISQLTVPVCDQLLRYFGLRTAVQFASLTDNFQSEVNVHNDCSCKHRISIQT
jgi:hypothetical protein